MTAEQKATIDRLIRKEMVWEYILSTIEWCEQRHMSSLGEITNVFNSCVGCGNNHYIRQIGRVDMEAMQYMLDTIKSFLREDQLREYGV